MEISFMQTFAGKSFAFYKNKARKLLFSYLYLHQVHNL